MCPNTRAQQEAAAGRGNNGNKFNQVHFGTRVAWSNSLLMIELLGAINFRYRNCSDGCNILHAGSGAFTSSDTTVTIGSRSHASKSSEVSTSFPSKPTRATSARLLMVNNCSGP